MALISCPECGKEISNKADKCIYCGYPLQKFLNTDNASVYHDSEEHREGLETCPSCGYYFQGYKCPKCGCHLILDNEDDKKKGINQFVSLGNVKSDGYTKAEKRKISEYESERVAYCPKCLSTNVQYTEKRLSIGRAIVGNAVAGPTGAILGGLSSKKGYAVCLNCGNRWKI